MKTIQLNPARRGLVAFVDDEDYDRLARYRWFIQKGTATFYAYRVVRAGGRQTNIMMHREIMGLSPNDGTLVDHEDFNGLNNQKYNMRVVTRRQNAVRQPYQPHSSKYLGVHWYKRHSKWQVYVHMNYKKIHLGYFESEDEAARARDLYVVAHDKTGMMALNDESLRVKYENNNGNSEQAAQFLDEQRPSQSSPPEAQA